MAQERADALTELGVPCAQRSGWVVLLDPVGLRIKLDPSGAVTGSPELESLGTPATEATLAPEPLSAPPEGDSLPKAAEGAIEARRARDRAVWE